MITHLPSDLLEEVFIKSNNPFIFAANRSFKTLARPIVEKLLSDLKDVEDGTMVAYICGTTPSVTSVMDLHESVRNHRGIAQLMISRTAGFDFENFSETLVADLDLVDAALQASEGYIFGLLPDYLQKDPDVILNTAHAFGLDTGSGTTVQELSETIQGIVLNAWEDFDDIARA
tara:strand:+ start:3042 stop:3563 length:522 start_codon:yes stop_codon:yes gene_type:complete